MTIVYSKEQSIVNRLCYPTSQAALKGTHLISLGLKPQGFTARVDKVLNHLNVFQEMENDLVAQGLQVSDAKRVVEETRNATHHAANMLQIYRRDPGDAHGAKPATPKTAYDAIKWASAICGLLEGQI